MGLSKDNKMGDDLTTSCIIQSNGAVDIVTGYNIGKSNVNIPRFSMRCMFFSCA